MDEPSPIDESIARADIPLAREPFMRTLLGQLVSTLEMVVGVEEASGFMSVVGQKLGDEINHDYRLALRTASLSRSQVADVLVDLKRRIAGDFYVIEQSDEKIVLGNRACPFGEKVLSRPSMCMITSNVFGSIAAENLGYARVKLEETIAEGCGACRIVIHLEPELESDAPDGREYFKG